MNLAQRVRRGLGMTQEQLGVLLGVSRITVVRWERGCETPGPVTAIFKMLEALPRETLAVLRGVAPPTPPSPSPIEAPIEAASVVAETKPDFGGAGLPPPSAGHEDGDDDAYRFGFRK